MNEFEREYRRQKLREQFRKSIELLCVGSANPPPSLSRPADERLVAVDNLSGLELIYHYLRSYSENLIGSPTTAFAVFNSTDGNLEVFTQDAKLVNIQVAPWMQMKTHALDAAQECCASFHGADGLVTCEMLGASAQGNDYAEAAMRAWLVHQSPNRSSEQRERLTLHDPC